MGYEVHPDAMKYDKYAHFSVCLMGHPTANCKSNTSSAPAKAVVSQRYTFREQHIYPPIHL